VKHSAKMIAATTARISRVKSSGRPRRSCEDDRPSMSIPIIRMVHDPACRSGRQGEAIPIVVTVTYV
jgi:hypothetical protein